MRHSNLQVVKVSKWPVFRSAVIGALRGERLL
jgi:hypothetical protein